MDAWTNPITDYWYKSITDIWSKEPVVSKGVGSLPELTLGLMQTSAEAYLEIQNRWMEEMRGLGGPSGAEGRMDSGKMASMWLESARKLVTPFLKAPAFGLTRCYQEEVNQATDKLNIFSSHLSKLLYQLYGPMDKASGAMREQLDRLAKEGKLSGDSEESYRAWISALESCYMELLQSPEYLQGLQETMDSYNEYCSAHQSMFGQSLKFLPIPSNKDFDELAREIYTLKKKYRRMSKQMEAQVPPCTQAELSGLAPEEMN